MATKQAQVRLTRWTGGTHPTLSNITRQMQQDGLRPFKWESKPNQRLAVRSHGYTKVLYVVNGNLEVTLPDTNQRVTLKPGDSVEVPARIRHGSVTGRSGATCLEAARQ